MSDTSRDDNQPFPSDRQPTIRMVTMPRDTNAAGHIFGGWIMSQMDIAGSIVAIEHASSRVVTIAVTSMEFHKPVYVGDLVSCFARIEKVVRTSITVQVEVFAQRNRDANNIIKVTQAVIVYVAVHEDGTPKPLPTRDPDFSHYF